MKRTFTLEYWIDDDWFVGRIREIPGVFSQGATLAELEKNIQDAYKMVADDQADFKPPVQASVKELVLQT